MVSLPLWVWVAATLGWCGAAMGVSFTIARQGSGGIKGKKLAVIGPFLVLPFMLLSALLPWANARVTLNFTYCWVTPCKLLLLGGANFLLDSPGWTLANFSHFLIAMLLPVRIKGVGKGGVGVGKRLRLRALLVELGALVSFFWWYDGMGERVRHGVHCGVLYLVLDLPHRIASMGLEVGWGVETQPAFRRPWLSTSLTDFWGNRWDLTANALLRHSVYNPIVNLLLLFPTRSAPLLSSSYTPKNLHHLLHLSVAAPEQMSMKERGAAPRAKIDVKPASCLQSSASLLSRPSQPLPLSVRLIGVNTTFFVSGLIHELLYFSLTQAAAPTWEVTAFFIVQGLATSAEITLRRACSPTHAIFQMPRPLKIVLTMCFMYATTASLFFPQLVRAAIFMTCTVEYRAIKEMLGITRLNTNMLTTLASEALLYY